MNTQEVLAFLLGASIGLNILLIALYLSELGTP